MTTTRELLERLLAATPHPPASGDVDELLAAMATLLPARQQILDELGDQPRVGTDAERALAREIASRDAAWQAALADARDGLGVARMGARQLRQYTPAVDPTR
jgi:hypothetical protein